MDGYLEAEAFLIVPNGESSTEDIFKPFLSNKPKELSMLKYLLSNHLRIVSAYPSEYLARSPLINPSPQLDRARQQAVLMAKVHVQAMNTSQRQVPRPMNVLCRALG